MKNYKKAFSLIELSIVVLIIGILIAGVTQSSRMIRQYNLTTAKTLTQSSPVAGIKDLSLWLETTSEKSFDETQTEDGLNVTIWNDINPQTALKPTIVVSSSRVGALYTESDINNLPTLNFAGNSSYEITNNNITPNALKTIFIVTKTSGTSPQRSYLYDSTSATNSAACAIGQNTFIIETTGGGNGLNAGTICAGGAACSMTAMPAGTFEFDKPYVLVIVQNAANSFVRYNGTQTANINLTMAASSGSLRQTMRIGNACSRNELMKGNIGEFIIFDRPLKAEEYKAVETYLGKKWGIKIS